MKLGLEIVSWATVTSSTVLGSRLKGVSVRTLALKRPSIALVTLEGLEAQLPVSADQKAPVEYL